MRRYLFASLILVACGDNGIKPDARPRVDSGEFPEDARPDSSVNPGSDAGSGSAGSDAAVPPDAFVAGDSQIWVVGDFVTDNTRQAGRFLSTDTLPIATFTLAPPATALPVTGFTQFTFDVSADGTQTAYVTDATTPGQEDLYLADKDGANPTLLVAGTGAVKITSIAFSPDGTKIAYTSDSITTPGGFDLFVVNTAGVPLPVQVSPRTVTGAAGAAFDVFSQFTWSPDSKFVGFTGDLTTDNKSEAFVVDTSVALPTAVTVLPAANITGTSVGSRGTLQWADNTTAYFRASVDGTTKFALFQGKTDGTLTNETANLPTRGDASVPDVGALGTSHDGTKLVVSLDAPTATSYDLYVTASNDIDPTKLTNLATVGHADFSTPLFFSPDDSTVAYIGDFTTPGVIEVNVSKLDGTDNHRLVENTVLNTDAEWLQWSADGTKIYAQGDLAVNNDSTVFALDPTATDQDISTLQAVTVLTGKEDVVNVIVRPVAK